MHLTAKDLMGRNVIASDGEMGKIEDIYFDDKEWIIRYFVVRLGSFFNHKDVILIPSCFKIPELQRDRIETSLSKQQIADSPSADSDMPVSRQYEVLLHNYYGWQPYWFYPMLTGFGALGPVSFPTVEADLSPETLTRLQDEIKERSDPNLCSFSEVKGYHLKAIDDTFGHLEDMVIDPKSAHLTHLVIDTTNWWPSQDVVLDVKTVKDIILSERCIVLSLKKHEVQSAPSQVASDLEENSRPSKLF